MAAAGQPIVTVMDISTLIAKVHLSQEQSSKLKVGTEAMLTIPGEDAPIKGKVSLISPALDSGSTTLEVWVAVSNKDASLKAGSAVHVAIVSETVPDALSIPNEALIATKAGDPRRHGHRPGQRSPPRRPSRLASATEKTPKSSSGLQPAT